MFAIALNESVCFHFAKIIAKLIPRVFRQFERRHDVFMKKRAIPSSEAGSGMHDRFHQPNHSLIMDFDAGNSCVAVCNG